MVQADNVPQTERRGDERFVLTSPVLIQVVLPELGVQPAIQNGLLLDTSRNGVKILLQEMDHLLYQRMIKGIRRVRIEIPASGERERILLIGRLMWIDYHKAQAASQAGTCNLGVALDERENPQLKSYRQFVGKLETK